MRVNYQKKINRDPRRNITTGFMGVNKKTGEEQMKKKDHFVFQNEDTGEVYYPELIELYGKEAKIIFVSFPSNNYPDFFTDDFQLWMANKTKKRKCNGEVCEHYFDETIGGTKYSAGTESECVCLKHGLFDNPDEKLKRLACGCDVYLKAWILNPLNGKPVSPLCYQFYTGSIHSANNIRSQLDNMKQFIGLPFALTLQKVKKPERSYTLWNLIPYLSAEKLIEYNLNVQFLSEGSEMKMLESGETVHNEKPAETHQASEKEIPAGETDKLAGYKKRLSKCFTIPEAENTLKMILSSATFTDAEKTILTNHCKEIKDLINSDYEANKNNK